MLNFLKGIVVGIGGISPGLSGSVLLVLFGLYQKTIDAIGTLFKNFKKNVGFLLPLVLGFGIGAVIFSTIVDFLLTNFEYQTRFAFLGLIVGTIPLFYKEMKKEGFNAKYYIVIAVALIVGCLLFYGNNNLFPRVENPNVFQSLLMGIAVAGSFIIPGVDSAAILSSLGLYELFVGSVARITKLDFEVLEILIPAGIGLIIGALVISFVMSKLIKRFYTFTFSVIFGLFLSIVPSVLNESCTLSSNPKIIIAIIFALLGFLTSFYLGDIKNNNKKIAKFLKIKTTN